jgi:hypothetical protein
MNCPNCDYPVPPGRRSLCPNCRYPLILDEGGEPAREAVAQEGLSKPTVARAPDETTVQVWPARRLRPARRARPATGRLWSASGGVPAAPPVPADAARTVRTGLPAMPARQPADPTAL